MKLAQKINSAISEGMHQNVKVRGTYEKFSSAKARLIIKEAVRVLNLVLDDKSGAPYPAEEVDMVYLKEAIHMANETMKKIKSVREAGARKAAK